MSKSVGRKMKTPITIALTTNFSSKNAEKYVKVFSEQLQVLLQERFKYTWIEGKNITMCLDLSFEDPFVREKVEVETYNHNQQGE